MKGKKVLITGATSGIGKQTAIQLARTGATIIFTSRDKQKGEKTKNEIISKTGNKDIHTLHCDLASLKSVKECSREYIEKFKKLHVLINNAGVWDFKRKESADGIENIFAINFLAPFLMTQLLLDTLKANKPARIINVTSGLHSGTINFDDIEFKNGFSGFKAYRQSKLALILFTNLLAKKLQGEEITVNCVHPGMVSTQLGRDAGWLSNIVFKAMGRSPEKGADTSVFLAVSPDVKEITGEYFHDRKVEESSPESTNMETAEKLWNLGLRYVHDYL